MADRESTPLPVPSVAPAGLTQRQRQILALLQAGKVNKEIARELGISLGTVKQHVVAIFKRLNVKNRTMAAYHGMERRLAPRDEPPLPQVLDGQLERRPCVVLSLALPEDADPSRARLLHGFLATIAFDHDALFLARKGNAGDVIFGVRRVSEFDVLTALRAVRQLDVEMSGHAAGLHGSLTAGVAVASMLRHGGWSGEAIASATIAAARELLAGSPLGMVVLDDAVRDLMLAFGMGQERKLPRRIPLEKIDQLVWTGERATFALVGREDELARLEKNLVTPAGQLVLLTGEAGMGKSRLCRELAERHSARGGKVCFFRCVPGERDQMQLCDARSGAAHSVDEALAAMRAASPPTLVILDDIHVAPEAAGASLLQVAAEVAAAGCGVLVSGRRRLSVPSSEVVSLGRLPADAVARLVENVLRESGAVASDRQAIVQAAAGVPLFAVEMARHAGDDMPLPLLVIVSARLDGLGLDRQLLQRIARQPDGLEEAGILAGEQPETVQIALEKTIASGVVVRREDGRFAVTHPLLRRVINHVCLEKHESVSG